MTTIFSDRLPSDMENILRTDILSPAAHHSGNFKNMLFKCDRSIVRMEINKLTWFGREAIFDWDVAAIRRKSAEKRLF